MSRLPAALAYGLIRRGCSPANLANARYAMATRRAWPAADGGRLAQQTRLAGHDDNNDMDEPPITAASTTGKPLKRLACLAGARPGRPVAVERRAG